MDKLLPPFCLVLALDILIAGFAVLGIVSPEAGVELHSARASGDEPFTSPEYSISTTRQLVLSESEGLGLKLECQDSNWN